MEAGSVLTAIAAYLGGIGTILLKEMFSEKRHRKARLMQAKDPFVKMQTELSVAASTAAAALASSQDEGSWLKAREDFWRLYWGPLALVEDRDLERAMVEFGSHVPPNITFEERPTNLGFLSLNIAKAARSEMASAWNPDFEPNKNNEFRTSRDPAGEVLPSRF